VTSSQRLRKSLGKGTNNMYVCIFGDTRLIHHVLLEAF
jgi:hypothetical protein